LSFTVWNGPAPTTAGQVSVAVANGVKTMLQLSTPSDMQIRLVGWGYSLDVAPAGIGEVELMGADVAATVTAHVAAGILNDDPNGAATRLTLGTANTGYTASVEGTIVVSRMFAAKKIPIAAGSTDLRHDWIWPYQSGPVIAVSKFVRIRTTFTATTPTMLCYIRYDQL
jgi:hypothetical protein